ncbi:MAG: hypothetical protein GF353_02955 [Candidatus Lokiarchaeota archaeon]|nr:hypothetical protein [Candidatus Lokiarchaeota archaeon]
MKDIVDRPEDIIHLRCDPFPPAYISRCVELKSDWRYDFYMKKVSATAEGLNPIVVLDYTVIDLEGPDGGEVEYPIYQGEIIASIDDVKHFSFGTSTGGLYKFQITVQSFVENVNIAQAVVKKHELTDQVVVNETKKEESESSSESSGFSFEEILKDSTAKMPTSASVFTLLGMSALFGVVLTVFYIHRKRGSVKLKL